MSGAAVVLLQVFALAVSAAAYVLPAECLVFAGARSFDLSELAGAVRHVSQAPESRGWTYSFSACGGYVVPPLSGMSCANVPPSAVLQQTLGECKGLGAAATRVVAATAIGITLAFSGGEGGRSALITIECADLSQPRVVRWSHGAGTFLYEALVHARAGCALECARDETGSVCGGSAGGSCISASANGAVTCKCQEGRTGKACDSQTALPPKTAEASARFFLGSFNSIVSFLFMLLLCVCGTLAFLLAKNRANQQPNLIWIFTICVAFAAGVAIGIAQLEVSNLLCDASMQQEKSPFPRLPFHLRDVHDNFPVPSADNGEWAWRALYLGNASLPIALNNRWTSQVGQDRTIVDLFDKKKGGFFLDLAANDASFLSNTLTLEQAYDWHGICIEANPKYVASFRGRKCRLAQAVVGPRDNEHVKFVFGDVFGGVEGFDNTQTEGSRDFLTVSVARILDDFGAPKVIDYLSLDIEGAEWWVFSTFPWDRYTFKTITIERPNDELRRKLEEVCNICAFCR